MASVTFHIFPEDVVWLSGFADLKNCLLILCLELMIVNVFELDKGRDCAGSPYSIFTAAKTPTEFFLRLLVEVFHVFHGSNLEFLNAGIGGNA